MRRIQRAAAPILGWHCSSTRVVYRNQYARPTRLNQSSPTDFTRSARTPARQHLGELAPRAPCQRHSDAAKKPKPQICRPSSPVLELLEHLIASGTPGPAASCAHIGSKPTVETGSSCIFSQSRALGRPAPVVLHQPIPETAIANPC